MVPGTRAHPARGESSDTRMDIRDDTEAPESPKDLNVETLEELKPEVPEEQMRNTVSEAEVESSIARTSQALEKIECTLSKLTVAITGMQEERFTRNSDLLGSAEDHHRYQCDKGKASENPHADEWEDGSRCISNRAQGLENDFTVTDDRYKHIRETASRDYEVYPTHVAYKIYQKGMQSTRCKRIGDGSFFIAKRSWDRLAKDFPTTETGMRRLLPLAFDSDARLVYEEIAGVHQEASCDKLWELLGKRLCNEVHQSALRDRFFAMTWNEKRESFEKFAWRLRSASLLLPDVVDDGLLLNRLKNGLPNRLQDQAKLVSGTFDEVVSRVSSLSSARNSRVESVREIREDAQAASGQENRNSQVDRFAHVRCHYCQKLGHISRDCEKKLKDRTVAGKGRGDQPRPAGLNPKRN